MNRWECDENDHLNVRFFVARHAQCLEAGLQRLGLIEQRQTGVADFVVVQHLRFLAEARIATPLSGYFGLVLLDDVTVAGVTEIRQ